MEKWIRPAQGELSRVELAEMKVHNTLFTTFYVQIVAMLKKKYGPEGATNRLRLMGEGCAETVYKYKKPAKTGDIKKLINEILDFSFYHTVDFKKNKDGSISFIDKNCIVCWEGVLERDVPYCAIVDGYVEKYLALIREEHQLIPKVEVRVVKSKATGDEYCEHILIL